CGTSYCRFGSGCLCPRRWRPIIRRRGRPRRRGWGRCAHLSADQVPSLANDRTSSDRNSGRHHCNRTNNLLVYTTIEKDRRGYVVVYSRGVRRGGSPGTTTGFPARVQSTTTL